MKRFMFFLCILIAIDSSFAYIYVNDTRVFALVVSNNATPTGNETEFRDLIVNNSWHNFTFYEYVDDGATQAVFDSYQGKIDVMIVSESVNDGFVSTKLQNESYGVVIADPLWDDELMCNYSMVNITSNMNITNISYYPTANNNSGYFLIGKIPIMSVASVGSYCKEPSPNLTMLAMSDTNDTLIHLALMENNSIRTDGSRAPNRRAGLGFIAIPARWNDNAKQIAIKTYYWTANYTGNVAPNKPILNYPIINYNDTFTFLFNYTIIDVNGDNLTCSMKINDVTNVTNLSVISGVNVLNSITFTAVNGTYNWSVNCTDNYFENSSDYTYFNLTQYNPNQVTGMAYSSNTENIYLTWTANTDIDLSNYSVYRSSDNAAFSYLSTATTPSYTNTGLGSGVTFYYKVSALDNAGNYGLNSSSLQAITVGAGGGGPGGGGDTGGTGGSPQLNVSECGLFIKYPSNRIILLNSPSGTYVHNVSFIICNTNNVPILHTFSFEGNLSQYCQLDSNQATIAGNSCYTGKMTCTTPAIKMTDRLIIKRGTYEDNTQKIGACESNIRIEVGRFGLLDYLKASLSETLIVFLLAAIVFTVIIRRRLI